MKKKIHFILPGGGVKGSFQAGFLYELHKSANKYFTISGIDGTSVGALNGYALALGRIDDMYEIWNNITSINDVFENWSNLPYLSNISSGYNLVNYYGLYRNDRLKKLIDKVESKYLEELKMYEKITNNKIDNKTDFEISNTKKGENLLSKFNCVVTSVREGTYKYINGCDKNIKDYITASASPWIVVNPLEIDSDLYTDGGLLHTFPIDNIENDNSDLVVLLGYDEIYGTTNGTEGNNALSYLGRIIDIVRLNHSNIHNIKKIIKSDNEKLVVIYNSVKINFLDFNPKRIQEGFQFGREEAKKFIDEYLTKLS